MKFFQRHHQVVVCTRTLCTNKVRPGTMAVIMYVLASTRRRVSTDAHLSKYFKSFFT